MKEIKSKPFIAVIVIAAIAISLILAFFLLKKPNESSEQSPPPEIITQARIENIIDVDRLATFEAIYNGIASVQNPKKPEETDYHVSYEATVKAGINFEDVEINVDNEKKIINISLPPVEINDINVDITSFDYIFINEDANTSTVSEQAYKKCIEDVENESGSEKEIYTIAEENAKNIIEALIVPFVQQLDNEYKIEIVVK